MPATPITSRFRAACAALMLLAAVQRALLPRGSDAERTVRFLSGIVRSAAWGLARGAWQRWRRGEPQHRLWTWGLEVRLAMMREVSAFSEHELYDDEALYPIVNATFSTLALPVYLYNAYLNPRLVRGHFEVRAGERAVPCDVWGPSSPRGDAVERLCRLVDDPAGAEPWPAPLKIFVYLHGGGLVSGTRYSSGPWGAHMVRDDVVVVVVEYALAPKHRYPAALEDAVAVVDVLAERLAYRPNLFLVGDSAGGGLALAAIHAVTPTESIRAVAGGVLVSPMLTQRHDADYHPELAATDVISPRLAHGTSKTYVPCSASAASNKLVSPMECTEQELAALPPIHCVAGTSEIFYSYIERFAKAAMRVNPRFEFAAHDGMVHCFPFVTPDREEAVRSEAEIHDFATRVMRERGGEA